jgi:hypothetical protein
LLGNALELGASGRIKVQSDVNWFACACWRCRHVVDLRFPEISHAARRIGNAL